VSGRPGTGILEIERARAGSVVARARAHSPLRLLMPRSYGEAAWVYTGSYGGGLLGGDHLELTVRVGTGARAFLSTQASTKVYRSTVGARFSLQATVSASATLIVWPDPVVCFRGSRYQQRQHVELDADATLVIVDMLTSGRHASGERWRFDSYANRLTVQYDGRPALCDAQHLSPDDGELVSRMGHFDVLCTAVLIGRQLWTHIDRLARTISQRSVERNADTLVASAPVGTAGCILRVAGRSTEGVARLIRQHLSFVPSLLGDDPWARKW
jgi:urease accessory protein